MTLAALCNRADFVGDVTVPDNTILQLSQPFTKTWRLRNAGTCTWTTSYHLVFTGGDQLHAAASVAMPINVAPGQTVDVSVNMVAPDLAGHYEGLWQLQSADGKIFGVGSTAAHIWVRIRAIPPAFASVTPTATLLLPGAASATLPATSINSPVPSETAVSTPALQYDFASNACSAQWQSNVGVLPCPGKDGDPNGFVLVLNHADLEDGSTISLPTLLTFPRDSADGYILAVYPEYQVQAGDHLRAAVGCQKDATSCSVLFRISYLDASSTPHDLWTLGEFYDGKYFNLDLDLSALAGQTVKFILNVNSLGSAVGDRALWVDPRIVRFPVAEPTSTTTPLPSPSPTSTPSPTATVVPPTSTAPAVTPQPPAAPPQPSPLQQILDSIVSFLQQLFGGK